MKLKRRVRGLELTIESIGKRLKKLECKHLFFEYKFNPEHEIPSYIHGYTKVAKEYFKECTHCKFQINLTKKK